MNNDCNRFRRAKCCPSRYTHVCQLHRRKQLDPGGVWTQHPKAFFFSELFLAASKPITYALHTTQTGIPRSFLVTFTVDPVIFAVHEHVVRRTLAAIRLRQWRDRGRRGKRYELVAGRKIKYNRGTNRRNRKKKKREKRSERCCSIAEKKNRKRRTNC